MASGISCSTEQIRRNLNRVSEILTFYAAAPDSYRGYAQRREYFSSESSYQSSARNSYHSTPTPSSTPIEALIDIYATEHDVSDDNDRTLEHSGSFYVRHYEDDTCEEESDEEEFGHESFFARKPSTGRIKPIQGLSEHGTYHRSASDKDEVDGESFDPGSSDEKLNTGKDFVRGTYSHILLIGDESRIVSFPARTSAQSHSI